MPNQDPLEQDSRFPSGPWKGYFLQPVLTGKHWMELNLTFSEGRVRGNGRDWVGAFYFQGWYDVETGKCEWVKQYIGRHAIAYQGYNEGRGIRGMWEWSRPMNWQGVFHIWPLAMGDPSCGTLHKRFEIPQQIDFSTLELSEELV